MKVSIILLLLIIALSAFFYSLPVNSYPDSNCFPRYITLHSEEREYGEGYYIAPFTFYGYKDDTEKKLYRGFDFSFFVAEHDLNRMVCFKTEVEAEKTGYTNNTDLPSWPNL